MSTIATKQAELDKLAAEYAKAESERTYLAEFRKVKKSLLMKEAEAKSPGLSAAKQECEAYAHPEYQQLLEGLKEATEIAVKCKWLLQNAHASVHLWQTSRADRRAEMRLAGEQ